MTGQLEKANQTYLQWIQEDPEDFTPYGNLAFNYTNMGYYEKAAEVTRESLRLAPDFATFNGNLEGDYLALGRLDAATALLQQAVARGVDGIALRSARYYVAFLQNDNAAMREQVAWAMGKSGLEGWLLSAESDTAQALSVSIDSRQ